MLSVSLDTIIRGLIGCIRSVFAVFTEDLFSYANIEFSIFDVLVGALVVSLFLKLVFSRMHIANSTRTSSGGGGKGGDDE